jgi:multicomponent Na+:H+ antiporter subunit A
VTLLLTLHACAAILAPLLVRWWGRNAFFVLAVVPAASAAWLVSRLGSLGTDRSVDETWEWLPSLDIDLALRLDPLAALLALLVTAVGALVLAYCARYFGDGSPGLARFAAVFLAFAGAMLGLVLADNMLLLYVFWELTTVFSYLLIGHSAHLKTSRRAAMEALVVTTAGGLAMLVGIIALAETSGSYLLSEVVASPPEGTVVAVALVLILLGALTKSAIFPFHFWLPAAMAAPTPVSAYLHAAAMVKAGIYLVARLAPGFADVAPWRAMVVTLGLVTMLLGAWRALRQHDLKLLLAYGTVSQLGFLLVLVGSGTRDAALAGVAMLLAHALFKATLFLVVGIVDRSAGTRDLRKISGLGRRMPLLAVAGFLGAASMAGLPPLAGFVGKEAAFDAYLHEGLPDTGWSYVTLAGLVAGSALTAAYSARFVWGAFATKPLVEATEPRRAGLAFLAAPLVLAVAGVVVGGLATPLDPALSAYAATLAANAEEPYHLALWHGLSPALGLSVLAIGTGALLFWRREQVATAQAGIPAYAEADLLYRGLMRGLDRLAVRMTVATQRGSLPVYLATIIVVLIVLPGIALLRGGGWPSDWRLWDSPVQGLVAVLAISAAVVATRAKARLAAVVLVGTTGYAVGVIFALHGAPDLALTQFLVESLTLVVFVLVLRKLPKNIVERSTRRQRMLRLVIALPAGMLIAILGAIALDARVAPAISEAFPQRAYDFGGGRNVVNVTLVDIRAWDTIGEISVLIAAATGVASLVFLRGRTGTPPRAQHATRLVHDSHPTSGDATSTKPGDIFLRSGGLVPAARRSLVLEVVTRLIFHTIVILSLYLLFAGHNVPGGGFAGGLVGGLALVVRYLAGGRYELGEAAPVDAGLLLGLGLLFAGGTGVAGLLLGADVLQTATLEATLPVFGDVKLVTSLFFDIGVYLIVLGLVLDVLRSLGAELDRQGSTRVDDTDTGLRPADAVSAAVATEDRVSYRDSSA